jgi:hypothetical protein
MNIAPRRLKLAVGLMPAAALAVSLVLGGPSLAVDPSTDLSPMRDWCRINEKGQEICTGQTGDGPISGIYVLPTEG